MSKNKIYSYSLLRYVHDITTGEFVNVGVVLFAPEERFVSALCRPTHARVSRVFPGMNTECFRSRMRHVRSAFEELEYLVRDRLLLEPTNNLEGLIQHVIPRDDSSLQWSSIGTGITTDPSATLESLFQRMVMRYEDAPSMRYRTEDDVWKHFKKTLEKRQLLHHFRPKKIVVDDNEVEFMHTWQNGVFHCLEPVSFDLKSADSIRDKAYRWLGRVASVASPSEPFIVYYLVGQPQDENMLPAYHSAISILKKSGEGTEIWSEQQADQLSEVLALFFGWSMGS